MIDLSANENPFGPSHLAVRAIAAAAATAHLYPDGQGLRLKDALADALGVESGQIVLGAGSCEVIELAARAILRVGDEAIFGWPSFPTYRAVIDRAGASAIATPLANWAYDLDAMAERVTDRTRLVILGNPNNPTGLAMTGKAFGAFLDRLPPQVTVIVDEAYREFVRQSDYADGLAEMRNGRPLIVTRTLSKAYGLAGLRIGFAIAPGPLARRIDAQRQRFNTGRIAQAAALAAIGDREHLARCVALNAENRRWLEGKLRARGLSFPSSQANFILLRVGDGKRVFEGLRKRNVLVKPLDAVGLADCIRVSVGRSEHNAQFLRALEEVLGAAEGRKTTCRQAI